MSVTDTEQQMNELPGAASTDVGLVPAAVSGILAAGAALAAGELVASFGAPSPGPVVAVANRVIDEAPTWFVDFGKRVFGLADKPALVIGTIALSLLLGAAFGLGSRRRPAIGTAAIVLFALVGLWAMGVDAQGGWASAIIVSLAAGATGVAVLRLLPRSLLGPDRAQLGLRSPASPRPSGEADPSPVTAHPTDPPVSRRRFLGWAGTVGAAGAVAVAGSREVRARSSATLAREAVEFTPPADTALETAVAEAGTGTVASTPGISPLIVPADDFYLIDTALTTPQVDPQNWSLTIRGLVDNEVTYSYDDLLDRAETIAPVTLSCVSNEVGGDLVGNAIWRGVPLIDLLDEAGVRPEATQIASRSVDGWSCGFPTEAAYDGRTALVAVGMNGEPLPLRHGFPARLVVSGLYGYVSATKWLKEIELTTIEDFDGYWIPRGWSKLGPVKTQSRIDTPRNRVRVPAGEVVPVAGVAWAPHRAVERVEVRIDDGEWQEAELGESLGPDAWVQWLLPWSATAGVHTLQVRATDGKGETQTSDLAPPAPDGATGWHTIEVEVA